VSRGFTNVGKPLGIRMVSGMEKIYYAGLATPLGTMWAATSKKG